jgi:uncharacterized membrane protein YdbT with pleckstrin-like domain
MILALGGSLFAVYVGVRTDEVWILLFGAFVGSATMAYFFARRLQQWYTIYVFTNERAMIIKGFLDRDVRSIQWRQVTNERWQQPFIGRILGYATLSLNTASEKAGTLEMADIPGRFEVNQRLAELLDVHRP